MRNQYEYNIRVQLNYELEVSSNLTGSRVLAQVQPSQKANPKTQFQGKVQCHLGLKGHKKVFEGLSSPSDVVLGMVNVGPDYCLICKLN
jgi:hypothetical protein